MSDLRFAQELGAEFERIAATGTRRVHRWPGIGLAVAVAVPVVIAVVAVALLHGRAAPRGTSASTAAGPVFATSGGNCRVPAVPPGARIRTIRVPGSSHGLMTSSGGTVAGTSWQLRVTNGATLLRGTEHGRFVLGGHRFGLCTSLTAPVPFELISAGRHGIVFGYVAHDGQYDVRVPGAQVGSNGVFFVAALPHPACAYRTLSVSAREEPVQGLPPAITRLLDATTPTSVTTIRFGQCPAHSVVPVIAARGRDAGRSPNAPLARVTAQLLLTPPAGLVSRAYGVAVEFSHAGLRGITVRASALGSGRYDIRLLGTASPTVEVGARSGSLYRAFDLPSDAARVGEILITRAGTGEIVLRGYPKVKS